MSEPNPRFEGVSPAGLRRIFRFLLSLAKTDGTLGHQEGVVLMAYARRFEITDEEIRKLRHELATGAPDEFGTDPAERALLVKTATEIAVADGKIDPEEQYLLNELAQKAHVGNALRERLSRRLREAKQAMAAEAQAHEAPKPAAKRPSTDDVDAPIKRRGLRPDAPPPPAPHAGS